MLQGRGDGGAAGDAEDATDAEDAEAILGDIRHEGEEAA